MTGLVQRVTRAKLRIEKRPEPSRLWQVLSIPISIVAALIVSSILIRAAGANVPQALAAMFEGAFGGRREFLETLVQATPLIFTSLAATIAFRGQVWNIGTEGQLFAGAMVAYWVSASFGDLPRVALIPMLLLAATLGGAVWGIIPGYMKAKFGANEIIVTVMMNYIIQFLLSFLLSGPWMDPAAFFHQTVRFPEVAHLPLLVPRSRLHLGFVISLIVAGLTYVLLWKTPFGYEIRAMGHKPTASKYKGINTAKTLVAVMAISGAIAGLAGGSELFGIHQRLKPSVSNGLGFTGIMVALLGRLHPVGAVLVSILFGALITGSSRMQISTGIPVAIAYVIQSIVLIFLLTAEVLTTYRFLKVGDDDI